MNDGVFRTRARNGWLELRRIFRGVMGADAYEKYLQYHAAHGHAGPPMTEKEFWREKTDRQDANPQGRCC
ncbi:YbdD/YjiX family protein [Haematomicrobium sanguinis]|uniref:YbdD/YjiX family protein n=1 Tax=Haematomicrobium sanguinis TaxID=479106 RepID=UPI00047E0730|nr:YbdD/YjiX family protein [Haematomicrobium sanguinis]